MIKKKTPNLISSICHGVLSDKKWKSNQPPSPYLSLFCFGFPETCLSDICLQLGGLGHTHTHTHGSTCRSHRHKAKHLNSLIAHGEMSTVAASASHLLNSRLKRTAEEAGWSLSWWRLGNERERDHPFHVNCIISLSWLPACLSQTAFMYGICNHEERALALPQGQTSAVPSGG